MFGAVIAWFCTPFLLRLILNYNNNNFPGLISIN
ncbi:MAG: hypothetical protein ACI9JL_000227 [Paracoccaceae bacterium]|jgi:hypothetical protein